MKWDSSSRPIRQSDESRSRFALSCSFDFVPNTHLTIPSYRRLLAPEISPCYVLLCIHSAATEDPSTSLSSATDRGRPLHSSGIPLLPFVNGPSRHRRPGKTPGGLIPSLSFFESAGSLLKALFVDDGHCCRLSISLLFVSSILLPRNLFTRPRSSLVLGDTYNSGHLS